MVQSTIRFIQDLYDRREAGQPVGDDQSYCLMLLDAYFGGRNNLSRMMTSSLQIGSELRQLSGAAAGSLLAPLWAEDIALDFILATFTDRGYLKAESGRPCRLITASDFGVLTSVLSSSKTETSPEILQSELNASLGSATASHLVPNLSAADVIRLYPISLDESETHAATIFNKHNVHWVPIVLYVQETKVKLYDSLPVDDGDESLEVEATIREALLHVAPHVPRQSWEFCWESVQPQDNGYDCGVRAIRNLVDAVRYGRARNNLDVDRLRLAYFERIAAAFEGDISVCGSSSDDMPPLSDFEGSPRRASVSKAAVVAVTTIAPVTNGYPAAGKGAPTTATLLRTAERATRGVEDHPKSAMKRTIRSHTYSTKLRSEAARQNATGRQVWTSEQVKKMEGGFEAGLHARAIHDQLLPEKSPVAISSKHRWLKHMDDREGGKDKYKPWADGLDKKLLMYRDEHGLKFEDIANVDDFSNFTMKAVKARYHALVQRKKQEGKAAREHEMFNHLSRLDAHLQSLRTIDLRAGALNNRTMTSGPTRMFNYVGGHRRGCNKLFLRLEAGEVVADFSAFSAVLPDWLFATTFNSLSKEDAKLVGLPTIFTCAANDAGCSAPSPSGRFRHAGTESKEPLVYFCKSTWTEEDRECWAKMSPLEKASVSGPFHDWHWYRDKTQVLPLLVVGGPVAQGTLSVTSISFRIRSERLEEGAPDSRVGLIILTARGVVLTSLDDALCFARRTATVDEGDEAAEVKSSPIRIEKYHGGNDTYRNVSWLLDCDLEAFSGWSAGKLRPFDSDLTSATLRWLLDLYARGMSGNSRDDFALHDWRDRLEGL